MRTLQVHLATLADVSRDILEAARRVERGEAVKATPSLNFQSYDEMHRVLAPSRLAIVRTLAGQGSLPIREVARRVGRDVQAVHRDVTTLLNAGVIERNEQGVEFPYDRIHFSFDVNVAA